MTAGDDIRVTRCRDLLTHKGAITRAALGHALNDPIAPQPPDTHTPPTERPGPDNTGVPSGTRLVEWGTVSTQRDGELIAQRDIHGMVKVQHDDVTILRCRIRASDTAASSDYPIKTAASVTGLVIEDCEIDGNGRTSECVGTKNYTLIRCNVHSAAGDFLRADGGCVIEGNWLHDFVRVPGGHHDGIQILKGSGVVIRGNTIDMVTDGDLGNSAFIISAGAAVDDVLIEGNYLNGGNYTLYLGANDKGIPVTNVIARGNVISGWRYGPITARGMANALGNVDHTGKAI